jgi:23S rRNA G2445 N2-methylase RlmL
MSWPDYDAALWDQLAAQAQAQAQRRTEEIGGKLAISGSDRDAGAVAMAAANAARAGVAAHLAFTRRTVSEIAPCCPHGWIVTNPPYGLRVGASGDLRNLYAQFGSVLQGGFRGWQVAVLSSDPNLLRQMRLELDTRTRFVNGGVAVTCGRGRVA